MFMLIATPRKLLSKRIYFALILMPVVLIISLGCGLMANEAGVLMETQSEMSLQMTQDAIVIAQEKATLQAQQTMLAIQATDLALQGTSQAQATNQAVQETIVAQRETEISYPTETSTPEITAIQATELVSQSLTFTPTILLDWEKLLFVTSSDCRTPNQVCWKTAGSSRTEDVSLFSKDAIFIDPAWPNPHLVFWHAHKFVDDANISVQVTSPTGTGSRWEILKIYSSKENKDWYMEVIDLEIYKGETIRIQFYTGVSGDWFYSKTELPEWVIQDVQIVPDYTSP